MKIRTFSIDLEDFSTLISSLSGRLFSRQNKRLTHATRRSIYLQWWSRDMQFSAKFLFNNATVYFHLLYHRRDWSLSWLLTFFLHVSKGAALYMYQPVLQTLIHCIRSSQAYLIYDKQSGFINQSMCIVKNTSP